MARSAIGSMAPPLTSPAFLERDGERRLGQLYGEQLAGGHRHPSLDDPREEVRAHSVEGLGCDQSLDYEARVERDRVRE